MGFKGMCFSSKSKCNSKKIPKGVESGWHVIQKLLAKSPADPAICFGDFSKKDLDSSLTFPDLQRSHCNAVPLDPAYNYGTVSLAVKKVPCGKPVTVEVCLVFDRCGTMVISMNGGTIACIASTTGIGAVISAAAEAVEHVQIGFSLFKKFQLPVDVVYANGDKVVEATKTVKGHAYIGLKMPFPVDSIKIGKLDVKKYVSINADVKYLINFGKVQSTVVKLVNQLRDLHKNPGQAKNIINTILHSGAEVAYQLKGVITIKLDSLCKGFFPDVNITINANLLVTLGHSDSGMPAGLYYKIHGNVHSKVLDYIKIIYDHFRDIIKKIGIKIPSFSKITLDIMLGLFIQEDKMGFIFKVLGQNVSCIFNFKTKKGHCNFGGLIFKAIVEAAKWVIKAAGKVIMKVAMGVGKFAISACNFVKNAAKKLYKSAKKVFKKVKQKVKKALKSIKKNAKKFFKKGFSKLKGLFSRKKKKHHKKSKKK